MGCVYTQGLDKNGLSLGDAEGLSSRAAGALAGVGKSTVNKHRAGRCTCGQVSAAEPMTVPDPTGRRDSLELGPDGGSLTYHTTDPKPISDWTDVLTKMGVDPDKWSVAGDTVRVSKWQQSSKEGGKRDVVWLSAYKAQLTPKRDDAVKLDDLIRNVRDWKPAITPKLMTSEPLTAVIALADLQLGKGEGDGTQGTVKRLNSALEGVCRYIESRRAEGLNVERVLLANMGDHIEAVQGSYANQPATVDLNLRDQLSLALEINMQWLMAVSDYAPVTYSATLCNHGAWQRSGRDSVMGDADNATGFIGDQLATVCKYNKHLSGVEFVVPRDEMITTYRTSNVNLAMSHGNKISGSEQTWLATQSQALTHRNNFIPDLWLTAHYHHAQVTDYGPYTRIQATTLDPGSKWLYDLKGVYSTPGVTVFLTGGHLPMKWSNYQVIV